MVFRSYFSYIYPYFEHYLIQKINYINSINVSGKSIKCVQTKKKKFGAINMPIYSYSRVAARVF